MSYIDYDDCEVFRNVQIKVNKYLFQSCKDKWKSLSGIEYELKDMRDDHLLNSVRMIERTCKREKLNALDYPIYGLMLREIVLRMGL